MPVVHRKLTGDNGRAAPVSIFQEFESVLSVFLTEGREPPVIKNEQIRLGQRAHELGIPPIPLGNGKFLEEAGQPQVEDRVAFPADLVAQGTGEPGFTLTRLLPL
jgi:hypothetical protein